MNHINKKQEPQKFVNWKLRHPNANFKQLPSNVKKALQNSLLDEQGYVCCFCGSSLGKIDYQGAIIQAPLSKGDNHNIRVAHIEPQSVNISLSLDYSNICASCDSSLDGEEHCDIAQRAQCLPVSPLEQDCLSFFSFDILGNIYPNKDKSDNEQKMANETIKILGLQAPSLVLKRQKAINILLKAIEMNACLLDSDHIEKIMQKDINGLFMEFYFVIYKYIKDNMNKINSN
ncbi:retron system putative HNH endonuclease [Desulfovibrio sp. ZJ200]|uniref:retron system putative HNH endonuclease n=1 Tax=Desulfovibrio sp. ZJ200 TaxID=2709792 RepID=UPI0013EADCE2|nr:retron system putative HNH endonuclease [Desulfovibrio sp. ZJ200]